MKKLIIILTALVLTNTSFAQMMYSNGARITVNGAHVNINGSLVNKGNLDLRPSSTMVVKGNLDNFGKLSNDGRIDLFGNLWNTTKMDNPVFGEWNFVGTSAAQNITSDSSITASKVSFINSLGFLVDVKNDLKITSTANFARGIVETLNNTKLRFSSSAIHTNASDTSHVKGIIAKEGTGNFVYPLGTGVKLQTLGVNASSNPTSIDIAYKQGDAGPALFGIAGAQATPLQSYNNLEYWQLNSGGAQGILTLNHDAYNAMSISTLNDMKVARQFGSQWLNQGGTATGTTTSATINSLNSTLDGNFTLGIIKKDISVSLINPSGKTSICLKDTLTLIARRNFNLNEFQTTTSFSISPSASVSKINDTTFKLFPSATTLYVLTGIDQNGLVGAVNFNLVVNTLPTVAAAIKNPIIINGVPTSIWPKEQSVEFVASGAVSYVWSPFTFVTQNTGSQLISIPMNHMTYNVIGTDANGCKSAANVSVRVFVVSNESSSSCDMPIWRRQILSKTGVYYDTVINSIVDSIFVMNFRSNTVNTEVKFENGKLASQCIDCQYQWYACKPDGSFTPIENAKSRILSITTIGSYTVEASNGLCSSKSPCISNSSSGIVVNDVFKNISVFPNPFVDKLNVKLDSDPVSALIQIVDLNGRVVSSHKISKATETTIDLSKLVNGSYIIQILFEKDSKKVYYTKIIKE